jgi:hypothetical protein
MSNSTGTLVSLADFAAEVFEPLVGQTLVFERSSSEGQAPAEPARMQLLEVHRGHPAPPPLRQPFSLLLMMKDQPPLSMALHRLIHDGLEPAELLISRVTVPHHQVKDPAGMYYELVFG